MYDENSSNFERSTMKSLITIALIMLTSALLAQPQRGQRVGDSPKIGIISGKVVDLDQQSILEYSNVAVYSVKDSSLIGGSIANENGEFKVTELPFGKFYVVVKFIGYEKNILEDVKIFPGNLEIDLGTVSLQSASEMLEELVVTAERSQIAYHVDRKVVNVSSNIMAAGGNAISVLETVPSIQVDIEGNILLRGSSNFTVFIDGKPTVLESTDVLQQIPASTIENIEIITNPSVKFDPDGVGGIINVVLKKKKVNGTSGVINAMVGTNDKYQTDFLIDVKKSKLNFFIGGDFQDRVFDNLIESSRISNLNDTIIRLDSEGEGDFRRDGKSLRFGAGYQISKKDNLTLSSRIGEYSFARSSFTMQEELTDPPGEILYFDNTNIFSRSAQYYSVDLSWDHEFSKRSKLTTYLFYSGRESENRDRQESFDLDEAGNYLGVNSYFTRVLEESQDNEFRIKLDYTLDFENGSSLESGYQWRRDSDEEDYFFYEKFDPNAEWPSQPTFTNNTEYLRNIHGAYATYGGKTGLFDYKLGLRAEYTDRNLQNIGADLVSVLERLDLFPSIHLARKLGETNDLYVSYSRRINRPRGYYLDPFPYFIDPFTIRVGNPDLEPEYIDSYELGVNKEFKKSFLSLEGYYRITNNMITRIQSVRDDGIFLNYFDNINRDFALGMEVSWNYTPVSWATFNISSNLYNYRIEGEVEGLQSNGSSTNIDGRLNANFSMGSNTRFQLNTILRGPTVTAQGERDGMWGMNLSVRQDFMDKRFSATLQVRDIFDTMNFRSTSIGENFTSVNLRDRESQIFLFTLSYKINNYRPKRNERGAGGFDEGM